MKKNFIGTILGSLALMLGFTSCKKDCTDCATVTYTYNGVTETETACADAYTEEEWNTYMTVLEAYAASDPNVTLNRFEDCE